MRVWLVCVLALFAGVQLYEWMAQITLPLPIYGVAGLLLAIFSNWNQLPRLHSGSEAAEAMIPSAPPTALSGEKANPPEGSPMISDFSAKQASLQSGRIARPQLPNLQAPAQSISFEIRRP